MVRRAAALGLGAALGVFFFAFAAGGAVAAPEVSNTVFTCIPGAGAANTDAHCDPGSTGTSGHVAIPEGEETSLSLSPIGTSELSGKIAGAKVVLHATGFECVECMGGNHSEVVAGETVMDVTGQGKIRFTGVTVNVPSCKVKNEEVASEPLKITTLSPTKAELSPVSGTVVKVIHFVNNGSETCTLPAEVVVTGHATGTLKGSTLIINTGANELHFGAQEAKITGEFTLTGGLTGGEHHPGALTAA